MIITYPKRPKGPSITCFTDVKRIAPRMGLTDSTMQMMVERGFGSVQGLREMTEGDIEVLPLYAGQQLAISKLITHLNEVLEGYEIHDKIKEEKEEEEEDVEAKKKEREEKEKEEAEKENSRRTSLGDRSKAGILNNDGYPSGQTMGPRTVPRPHEFMVGKTAGRELSLEEFLYGNLLIMEYMMEQQSTEVRAYMKHMRFMVLKLVHGYPLDQIVYYDYALRTKMEKEQIYMPLEADQDLLEKYLRLHKKDEEAKKKKKTTKGGKAIKGKGKKKKASEEDEVIGL